MRRFLKEFTEESTIHGVRYFTERRRHWTERLWWMVAFSLSLCLCIYSILNVGLIWRDQPVKLILSERDEPISAIPFPTVTICPHSKFHKNIINFMEIFDSIRKLWRETGGRDLKHALLETAIHICPNLFPVTIEFADSKFTNSSIYDIMRNISLYVNERMQCNWRKTKQKCSEFFQPIFTDDGLCYVFNSLNSDDMYSENMAPELMTMKRNPKTSNWNFENGYAKNIKQSDYPKRTANAKQFDAFYTILDIDPENIDYMCTGEIDGYKVTLNTPGEIRRSTTYYYDAILSEHTVLSIKPKLTTTSDNLRAYTPNQRQCYFNSERQLRYFKIYTQNNCETECISNFTNIECGCVKFSMPRDANTKICGHGSIQCYTKAENKLFEDETTTEFKNETVTAYRENCNCLPACTSIKYEAYIDRVKFNGSKHALTPIIGQILRSAALSIYFGDPLVATLYRDESLTYTDFFADCGGLLGLFLGMSMLSVVEFVYYSTLRLYWNFRLSRVENVPRPVASSEGLEVPGGAKVVEKLLCMEKFKKMAIFENPRKGRPLATGLNVPLQQKPIRCIELNAVNGIKLEELK